MKIYHQHLTLSENGEETTRAIPTLNSIQARLQQQQQHAPQPQQRFEKKKHSRRGDCHRRVSLKPVIQSDSDCDSALP